MNHTGRNPRLGIVAVLFGIAGAAAGQNQWLVDITYSDPAGVINSLDDTATIKLWAAWDAERYAFKTSTLDMIADDLLDAGGWSFPFATLKGPNYDNGSIDGESVYGIVPSQLHWPDAGLFADRSNPILVWTAEWQTSSLTQRVVRIDSTSREFWLYLPNGHGDSDGYSENFLGSLVEGSGAIVIVPAPSALVVLLSGCSLFGRKRHRR